jgi:glutaconyl-CoA/methylmalonyl-CoA decarboxylase subunit gamma
VKLKITVHGVAYEVDVEVLDAGDGFPTGDTGLPAPPQGLRPASPSRSAPAALAAAPPTAPPSAPAPAGGGAVAAPVAGTIVEVRCKPGARVAKNDVLVVIEAMKMNTNIAAPVAGEVASVSVAVGDNVREGQVLVSLG